MGNQRVPRRRSVFIDHHDAGKIVVSVKFVLLFAQGTVVLRNVKRVGSGFSVAQGRTELGESELVNGRKRYFSGRRRINGSGKKRIAVKVDGMLFCRG